MTATRADLETILISRAGKLLAAADLDGETRNGTNGDLNDPLATGLRRSGYSVASLAMVSDSDVAAIADDDIDKVLDLAELRCLENIEGNYDDVDISVTDRSESLSQLVKQVQTKIDRLQKKIERAYGIGQGTLSAGTIGLDFMQKNDVADGE